MKLIKFTRIKALLTGACLLWLALGGSANAAFLLESMGIVLDESEGRASFTVKNTSAEPILLASKLEDLDGQEMSKNVLVSPPITRIDAGQSQQVNFVLKKSAKLEREVMLKASFEGIGQAKENAARMPIKQSIGMILQPIAVAVSKTPWDDLSLKMAGQTLVINNTGKHVVRLSPDLMLAPANEVVSLENYYVMPGEERRLEVKSRPTTVKILPLSRYGFKLPEVVLKVAGNS
ncbi:fimbria/pilus chaperone family protein [Serratia sp. IR-2025]|uniref:fimbria/pilus chaperone family protein n=1 Tax=Serratia marcescens TaxID=615 RepID=UPI0038792304